MEVKIGNAQHTTTLGEVLADRRIADRKDARIVGHLGLALDESPRFTQQRHPLVVACLAARILAVAHENQTLVGIDVAPVQPADFAAPHRGGHREAHDVAEQLAAFALKPVDDREQLVVGWPALALATAADQVQVLEQRPRRGDHVRNRDLERDPGVAQHGSELAHFHVARVRPGSFVLSHLAVGNDVVGCERHDVALPKAADQVPQHVVLVARVGDGARAVTQIAIGLDHDVEQQRAAQHRPRRRRDAAIDVGLDLTCPSLGLCLGAKSLAIGLVASASHERTPPVADSQNAGHDHSSRW